MMNVKELLKSKGLRYGKVRADFLQHLFDASTPMSAVDILKKPNMKEKVDANYIDGDYEDISDDHDKKI